MTATANQPPFSRIAPDVRLGKDVQIFGFVNLYGCEIGDGTKIGCFVQVQKGVKIGKNCKIQDHASICEGVTIEDEVFIGPGVHFTNDLHPRATTPTGVLKAEQDWECVKTVVRRGAAIGANATILCGIEIGEGAEISAGAFVAKDVPPYHVVVAKMSGVMVPRK